MFHTQTEARRFFVDEIVRQAEIERIKLSDDECQMLLWSESAPDSVADPELADRLTEEISDADYESKIEGLHRAVLLPNRSCPSIRPRSSTLYVLGLFTNRRREYRDAPAVSRWHGLFGGLFIFAAAVVVAKLSELQFDRFFYVAAAVGTVILVVSTQRLAYIAAAFAWMGFRLLVAGAFTGKWWAFGLGALFAGIAYGALVIAASREKYDSITNYWRR